MYPARWLRASLHPGCDRVVRPNITEQEEWCGREPRFRAGDNLTAALPRASGGGGQAPALQGPKTPPASVICMLEEGGHMGECERVTRGRRCPSLPRTLAPALQGPKTTPAPVICMLEEGGHMSGCKQVTRGRRCPSFPRKRESILTAPREIGADFPRQQAYRKAATPLSTGAPSSSRSASGGSSR